MGNCPVNFLFAVLGRQTATRVHPDADIMSEFRKFTDWVIEDICSLMKTENFEIEHS